jgi:hypothetical protein
MNVFQPSSKVPSSAEIREKIVEPEKMLAYFVGA